VALTIPVPDRIRTAMPYIPGKPAETLAREFGLDPDSIIKMASNENPLGMSPKAAAAMASVGVDGRYPDAAGFDLVEAIAAKHGVSPESVILGNGSENIIELVAKTFMGPGTSGVVSQYAFICFELSAHAVGADLIRVPAREYGHDLTAMSAAITESTVAIYVANPNNPTGTFVPRAEMEAFIRSVPDRVLVVLDEAYYDYLAPEDRFDGAEFVKQFPNVLMTRTFSKVYGLAPLRVAYGLSSPEIVELMNRVRLVFNVSSPAQAAALAALADEEFLQRSYDVNRAGMDQVISALNDMGLRYVPSKGNFVLVEVGDAVAVDKAMLRAGVIVRPVAGYGLPTFLRLSIGLPEENARMMAALKLGLASAAKP
jgi:histidinol-phosphate aminotransferase